MGITERLFAQITDLKADNQRLEKEAKWLSEKCAFVCHAQEDCDSDCPLWWKCGGRYKSAQSWQEAAHEAVCKDDDWRIVK